MPIQLQKFLKRNAINMMLLSKQTLKQSNIVLKRTFKCWNLEVNRHYDNLLFLCPERMSPIEAEMYYNGGYSPKQAIQSHARIPVEIDLFTC